MKDDGSKRQPKIKRNIEVKGNVQNYEKQKNGKQDGRLTQMRTKYLQTTQINNDFKIR